MLSGGRFNGRRSRELREQKLGLNQEQLGKLIGLAKVSVGKLERAEMQPSPEVFVKLWTLFGVQPSELLISAFELPVGLVEPGTDNASCERCDKQAMVYIFDREQTQHFSCLDDCGVLVAKYIRDRG